jgi:predicted ribosome quality control (RQC) complex YloA/Tae2 family protein
MLTDEHVARRILDLLAHKEKQAVTREDLQLAMYGRHFRVSDKVKVVVGRDEWENQQLEGYAAGRWQLRALDHQGPLTLVDGEAGREELTIAARLTARYCDGKQEHTVRVQAEREGEQLLLAVAPLADKELEPLRIQ